MYAALDEGHSMRISLLSSVGVLLLAAGTWTFGQSSSLATAKLEVDRIGPVRLGMTLDEASQASKVSIKSQGKEESECEFAAPVKGPEGLGFWLVQGRIAAIQLRDGPVMTATGIKIGDPEQKVIDAHQGKIKISRRPSAVDQARKLQVVTADSSGNKLEMTFFSWQGKIGSIIVGRPIIDQRGKGCQYSK